MLENITGVIANNLVVDDLVECEIALLKARSCNKAKAIVTNLGFLENEEEISRLEARLVMLKRFRAAVS